MQGYIVNSTQRAQYPLIKEYGSNYIGLHIMIYAIFLNSLLEPSVWFLVGNGGMGYWGYYRGP